MNFGRVWVVAALLMTCLTCWAQDKRKIIIDQDAAGPAGSDQQSMLLLIQSPQTDVLGITVVTGDAWLKSEVAHTLRMLELIGRTDIPVVAATEVAPAPPEEKKQPLGHPPRPHTPPGATGPPPHSPTPPQAH